MDVHLAEDMHGEQNWFSGTSLVQIGLTSLDIGGPDGNKASWGNFFVLAIFGQISLIKNPGAVQFFAS